jgi:hypothetical protein
MSGRVSEQRDFILGAAPNEHPTTKNGYFIVFTI